MSGRLFAALYPPTERLLGRRADPLRHALIADLTGQVLEIGAGTGALLPRYASATRVLALDRNPHMLRRAHPAARARSLTELLLGDACWLPLAADSVDAVVSSLVLCSVPRPEDALAELTRVLRPGGKLRLLEHVRSDRAAVAAAQHLASPLWSRLAEGCRLDRDTESIVREAGFAVEKRRRLTVGVPHVALWTRAPRSGPQGTRP